MSTLGCSPKAVWPIRPPRSFSIPVLNPQVSPTWAVQQMGSESSSDSADFFSPPPAEMNTIWIWIPTGSKKRNRHASSVQQLSLEAWGDERVSVSADIWGSYSEFTRFSKKHCHKYLCNWLEDCILALSFLKLAHRISDVHDRGLFFNAPLTFCSRLRNTYPDLQEIFFNQTA